jgi:hypothetical protein
MEAVRRQPAMLKGLSHFLVEHERCGAGFDVAHPSGLGSGHISIVCRGCGARHDYATATIEFEREIEFAPVPVRSAQDRPMPPPVERLEPLEVLGPLPPLEEGKPTKWEPLPPAPEKSPSGAPPRKGRSTRDRVITGGLLVFAAAALTFAVIRISNSVNQSSETSAPTPIQSPATSKAPKAAAAPRVRPGPIAPIHAQTAPKAPIAPAAPPVKKIETAHFAIAVPVTWTRHSSGGGLTLAPAGGSPVSIQAFYENDPGLSMQRMTSETASFLRSRDPGATVSGPVAVRVAGNPGFKLRANGPAGSQTALAVLSGPYRYLVVESVDPGTPATKKAQADRALDSFRPR